MKKFPRPVHLAQLAPLVLLLAVTLPHLGQGDFRRDTGRYAAVAHDLWNGSAGGSPLLPRLHPDTPYFNKPPLAFWMHGLFLHWFGLNLPAARLPSILAALGIVVATMAAARQVGSRSEAIVSGIVLALTYEFFRRTREISLDLWMGLFIMVANAMALAALRKGRPGLLAMAGLPLGLALLCKPLVPLGDIVILAAWAVLLRRGKLFPFLVPTTIVALAVALPWHVFMYQVHGKAFLDQYLGNQVIDRARGLIMTEPWHYYLVHLLSFHWPWLAFLVVGGWNWFHAQRRRRPGRDLFLLGGVAAAVMLVGLSLFPDKKPNYAVPVYPMLAWMAAASLCRLPLPRLRTWYRQGFRGLATGAAVTGVVIALLPIRFQQPADPDWLALLDWLAERPGFTLAVTETADPDWVCYLYVRQGRWPPRVSDDASNCDGILVSAKQAEKLRPEGVLFSAGPLRVIHPAEASRPGTRPRRPARGTD